MGSVAAPARERRRLLVRGTVQGVGFRPFVYRLAGAHELAGWVRNTGAGVEIEVEGVTSRLDAFAHALTAEAPPLARLDAVEIHAVEPAGDRAFTIFPSHAREGESLAVPPDVATCAACLEEVNDPSARRYSYPFTNCTDCGPRFTIIEALPYDRARTTMRGFALCEACRAEYEDPADRRFHAEPIACPVCGPTLRFRGPRPHPLTPSPNSGRGGTGLVFSPPPLWGRGRGRGVLPRRAEGEHAGKDALRAAVAALCAGQIVAVKGLGGFQLACNAADESAVSRLRERKAREARPFAIMVRDLEAARALCEISAAEAAVLSGPRAPIVLLRRRHPLLAEAVLAEGVAPGLDTLGIMLPGTPLHHLLLREFGGPLVMTSGNRSEEPIVIGNEEAEARLSGITDALLLHDREIASRYDDSVVRVDDEAPVVLRRARGFAPEPIRLPRAAAAPILATGAQLKNTFCLVRGDSAFVGQHIGDLDDALTLANYQQTLALYRRLFAIEPMVVAHDLHPNYAATRFAHSLEGVTLVAVQHHHAHVVSCMAEHGVTEPVIGVAFDGTGYGTDGAVWGGELLVADWRGFRRVAHLAYLPLPGGDAAAREPWRMALAALIHAFGEEAEGIAADLLARIPAARRRPVLAMARRGFNAPPTSSVGRLFDAVAALAGVRDVNQYEGQAAMELEARLDQAERSAYALPLHAEGGVWDPIPLICAVVDDVRRSTPCGTIAARFHNALGAAVVEGCMRVREAEGLDIVALSGGCFQNRHLLIHTRGTLERAGFRVLTHRRVPPSDGGISLGQAAVAIAACEQL